ncbi:MAG TPA: ABC transporter ATP-binding protein [Thermomicrobiales bacterium]|jgi:ATP-binding cassette subfamily B protein
MSSREFTVADEYPYDRRSPGRWITAHVLRYPILPIIFIITTFGMAIFQSVAAVQIGRAFDAVAGGASRAQLSVEALRIAGSYLIFGLSDIVNSISIRVLFLRIERDTREEIYLSLLGKSQTFLGQQRLGDLMARATNDVQQVNELLALSRLLESALTLTVPLVTIALLDYRLLLVPLIFLVAFSVALRRYNGQLRPLAIGMRSRFGLMNARLAEAIAGIEVVKGFAQEKTEEREFVRNAGAYRDVFVKEGEARSRYLPLLLYGIAVGCAFGHALLLLRGGAITVGQVITYMALIETLRFPTAELLTTFSTIQQGFASTVRILSLLNAETELDENTAGVAQPIEGAIAFEGVSFGYRLAATPEPTPRATDGPSLTLRDLTFTAAPGETIAIVGQTGAGKTTLTRLINRTFDPAAGRILIDGIDVRDWSLDSLRSQIATIEQDTFLFSRTIGENIAFGARGRAGRPEIEETARLAQAHDFISALPDGYDTVVGERGVTLSGGQRQRIAIARAFLTDPRILILDDSTSAVDSNTEDQIQRAMRRILEGRTTLLITHRLSQIRAADRILLLKNGAIIAQGDHDHLLATSPAYRQIFSLNAPHPAEPIAPAAADQLTAPARAD